MDSTLTPFADNFIPVIPVDYEYHTDKKPFCWDEDCPCHSDAEHIAQVKEDYEAGLLTAEEVDMVIKGKTL